MDCDEDANGPDVEINNDEIIWNNARFDTIWKKYT